MTGMLNWGILTAGRISGAFASGLVASKTGRLVATGARDLDRASEFAGRWGGRAYEGYQAVLDDPEVQAVYIATPHHLHAEWTMAAARAGKAILCEKPFTLDAPEAERAIAMVRECGVFFMEAFMYRCSPQMRRLVGLLEEGAIGTVRAVRAEFSYMSDPLAGNFRNVVSEGGGGIMDVGSYCVSFARMVAGCEPDRVEYAADLSRGYDSYGAGLLSFPNGVVATIASGMHLQMRNEAVVYGDAGCIVVDDPWKSSVGCSMRLLRGDACEEFSLGVTTAELYAHEADAVATFLADGECPWMSIEDTLGNMRTLDRVRASCGLVF